MTVQGKVHACRPPLYLSSGSNGVVTCCEIPQVLLPKDQALVLTGRWLRRWPFLNAEEELQETAGGEANYEGITDTGMLPYPVLRDILNSKSLKYALNAILHLPGRRGHVPLTGRQLVLAAVWH